MKGVLVHSFTEEGYKPIESVRLNDDEYGRGLQCFTPSCADIVPVDKANRKIYLAIRKSKPMTGPWWIGGRMAPNDTKEAAAIRNFKRETGMTLTPERIQLAAIMDYRWKDREQAPQDVGCHMVAYTFTVELTPEEIRQIESNLEKQEYLAGCGLRPLDGDGLRKAEAVEPIMRLYDHLFGEARAEVECGEVKLASSDTRRDIYELAFTGSAFQTFMIRDVSKPLGQHFHKEKFEVFYFLEGGGTIRTAEVDRNGKIIGEVKVFEMRPGSAINIQPWHTHRFDLLPNSRFVAFSSKPFDPNDMTSCPINL